MPDSIRRPPSEPAAPSGQGGSDGRQEWPGQRLGLPRTGPRSIARLGRRVAGVSIDWALAYVVAFAFFDGQGLASDSACRARGRGRSRASGAGSAAW
jgi:hypothetical protein